MIKTDVQCDILIDKYIDIIVKFSEKRQLSLNEAFHKFYQSKVYATIQQSDAQEVIDRDNDFFVEELIKEYVTN